MDTSSQTPSRLTHGYLTYDCAVEKMDADRIRAEHEKLFDLFG